jgi:uncharacterized protein (TIGR02145 family)
MYSWYGATAGTGTSGLVNTIATGSICPTGWHLPTYGNVGTIPNSSWGTDRQELTTMRTAIGNSSFSIVAGSSSTLRMAIAGGAYPGYFLADQSSAGAFWSSSAASSSSDAYQMFININSGDVIVGKAYAKYNGFAVRCILNAN